MKDIDKLVKKFGKEYASKIKALDNNLAYGIGFDDNGEQIIAARLSNENGKELLPTIYHGVKVDIRIIGKVSAYSL